MCWNKWQHPLTACTSWYFPLLSCVRKSGGSYDEGKMFEDEERCLNLHPLFWGPSGGGEVCEHGKASHVLFRVRFAFVPDQDLIERGSDWWFLSLCENVCSGMLVNLQPRQRPWSVLSIHYWYIICKVQQISSKIRLIMCMDRLCHQNIQETLLCITLLTRYGTTAVIVMLLKPHECNLSRLQGAIFYPIPN